jgi:transposase
MELYVAFDVHSSSSVLAVVDEDGRRLFSKKVRNDPESVVKLVDGLEGQVMGVVVESTYNWYWIVDALMEAGYRAHLANPSKVQKYKGLKHADDKHDAFWLAEMLRLGILPEGYIYPKSDRPVRDLLRKRSHLVRLRTSLILGLESIITRNYGVSVSGKDIKVLTEDRVSPLLEGDEYLRLAGVVSKRSIDNLTREIGVIEKAVVDRVKLTDAYRGLVTISGVGKILGLTIMLETGPIGRFGGSGNYVSYCRKVPSEWLSDGKRKGSGSKKNGNKYLAWAFSEASELARLHDPLVRRYYDRKMQRTNRMVAHSAVAHKLARAAYYIMRDGVEFSSERCFGKRSRDGEPAVALV